MKAALFALRFNELLGDAFSESRLFINSISLKFTFAD